MLINWFTGSEVSTGGTKAEECKDTDKTCTPQSCLDRPYTARTKCAKTCGFCETGSSHGSLIDLRTPSIDQPDGGSIITLDTDDTSGSRPGTAKSGHSVVSGGDSRRPSTGGISSRTDSIRKPPSTPVFSLTTTRPPVGGKTRYPGRTGMSIVVILRFTRFEIAVLVLIVFFCFCTGFFLYLTFQK
ncbi:unnamed protein product [Gongylonema pulchrum]|uniref:ShKT domain-containing protein n=1 Tax=Gongylonema pulchrum TaxID=637853 RepID=A0A183DM41_9BILA|nr:unnamed protein product [Gongylonema pulchrum]